MKRPNEPPLPDPLAYFFTWPTYGTWLPGDDRGWVKHHRGFQIPTIGLKRENKRRMSEEACVLDGQQRHLVETTVTEHCLIRGWKLYAVNCRSNHVHIVAMAKVPPHLIRDQFKAWCTRKLKQLERERAHVSGKDVLAVRENWWAQRGSNRYINDEESLEAAVLYVRDGQETRWSHEQLCSPPC